MVRPSIDLNMTWFVDQIDATGEMGFKIKRQNKECRTPRRNPEIDAAFVSMVEFHEWADQVASYFQNTLGPVPQNSDLVPLSQIDTNSLFIPGLSSSRLIRSFFF